MQSVYHFFISLLQNFLPFLAIFNHKIELFVKGRKNVFSLLDEKIFPEDKVIWMHCASLGEFEQGRPILEKYNLLKDQGKLPKYKIVLTFFSPSGYEVRKNYEMVDLVTYLPLDTLKNATKFIEKIHPDLVIFVKYDFWPNFLQVLRKRNIKTFLISAKFRQDQAFFKKKFSWYRNQLKTFQHFFVQDEISQKLLNKIGYENVTISGDTRFDRVFEIAKNEVYIPVVQQFVQQSKVIVAGSTWKKDLDLFTQMINNNPEKDIKYILAPHDIDPKEIAFFQNSISTKSALYTQSSNMDMEDLHVLIIDTIGLLSKLYYYADITYVGGGFGVGIHNILEPAAFGKPIVIGPNFFKFKEATDLIDFQACIVLNSYNDFEEKINLILENAEVKHKMGKAAKSYVLNNIGATEKILGYIQDVL